MDCDVMDTMLRWEKNGNIVRDVTSRNSEQGCTGQGMLDSNQSGFDSDWNSNQFLPQDIKHTDRKELDDSFFKQYSNIKDNANKDYFRKSPTSPAGSPTAIYGSTLHQKDISYDDLSKNIDANLAEIDMETFRSEDINSILALPAIYSGDFQSDGRGEQCASVSGSLLNGLELDTSTRSNRHSEDEISISKDEPLFSPLREPPVQATISVDSLDNSSSYEQDLVLTCKANKNNYTIVFEGSSTQFSDDSDYQDVCRSSEGEGSAVQLNCNNHSKLNSFKKASSMVQSDVAFTTWSKLWKSHKVMTRRRSSCDSGVKVSSSKSQSLPDLNHSSVFITDKQLSQWAKWCGNHRFPMYEMIRDYQVSNSKECLHSVSLLKLFMKHKVSSNSSIGSSGQSDSSTSLILQPLNFRNASLQNSFNTADRVVKPLQRHTDDQLNDNETQRFVDNIWNSMTEANNNNINSLYNNNTTDDNAQDNNNTVANEDCDNSQYFEDSLMDVPSPPLKHFHATPIKEEEETDISSGDEVMRDSKNPFGSDDSSSGEIVTVVQNNSLDTATNRQDNGQNLERINNVFPVKSNMKKAYPQDIPSKKAGEIHSQSTQTKQFNINDCTAQEVFKPLQTFGSKTSSNQTESDTTNTVHYTTSRDSSPASSGYVSSRHSSVERMRPSSQSNIAGASPSQKTSVELITTCTCGTQIPVHVKDSSVQTSTLNGSSSSSGFTLKESTTTLPEPSVQRSQTTVKTPLLNMGSQTKQRQKDKKSIYVCYPNYSLPDLSFLKSVIAENSESVFLAPTEYKLPQNILNPKRPPRPKSYTAYESLLQKQVTKIKDWESLNVLLPDDLKILLSKTQGKTMKNDCSDSKIHNHILSSSYCNVDDATKLKSNFVDSSYKRHVPRSILRKSNSVEQCEDKQCRVHVPLRCTSASSVMYGKDGRSPDRDVLHFKPVITDFSKHCTSSRQLSPDLKQFSPCRSSKSPSPLLTPPENLDKILFENYKDDNLLEKNIPCTYNNENLLPSFSEQKSGDGQNVENCLHGKKAVKFCERSPTKISKQLDACKTGRCCSCDTMSRSSEFLEKARILSPTHNTLMYPDISDSYTLQNFSGGGKFFQEALRRKTGLVENLRKATQIIFEHHKNLNKKGMESSYSMGQKILTWLCPAVHTILSDGLLPSVQGFFGPLPNSPWKVAGASIKQGETKKEVEDLLNHVTSEKLLTDSTYRFNAFILGLLNLGCFEWWLGHLCGCQSLICHHYHPTALLSLLALPAAVHLRHELKELVSPLSNLSFDLDILLETKVTSNDNWKKYDEGNFRPDAKVPEARHSSPYKQSKTNDFSLKSRHSHTHSSTPRANIMNIRSDVVECQEVWPGITINPFPNAKFTEDVTSHSKKEKNHSRHTNYLRDVSRRNDVPHLSLCSSADSGCSSQIEHQHPPPTAESPNETQQFKLLRQKWEKMSHGMDKQRPMAQKVTTTAVVKPTISSSSKLKKKADVSPKHSVAPKTPTKTVTTTPPSRRAQGKTTTTNEVKLSPSSPGERRSQIPTLKLGKQPKSMIPVQKVATRMKSANRDPRFSSD